MADDAASLLARQSSLESQRVNFNTWWDQIAFRLCPHEARFISDTFPGGQRRFDRMFDGTPATALDRFAAVAEDLVTPHTQIWNTLVPSAELEDDNESRQALEELNNRLYQLRYRPGARFSDARHSCYKALGAWGNYALMIHDAASDPNLYRRVGPGPVYEYWHTREIFWETDAYGNINRCHRKYKLTGAAAKERFGDKLPQSIASTVEKDPFKLHLFLQVIQRNEDIKRGRKDYQGWDWSTFFVSYEQSGSIMEVNGYKTWPIAIGRYSIAPAEVYARSPAMLCWPAILSLEEEKKTIMRAGQKAVDPPILLAEEGALSPFNLRPGALNPGLVTDDGTPLAVPFKSGADIPLGLEIMALEQKHIGDTFLTETFKALLDNPQMTATQVLEIAHERGVLLAPTMMRLHNEDLGNMIAREIQILADNGMLPDLPDQLRNSDDQYKIEFQSTLARAMRAQEAIAITRMFEVLPQALQMDSNAAYVFDVPEAVRMVGEITGVPAKLMRDAKTVAKLAAQEAAQKQAEQAVAAAPDISKSALNAAQAQSMMGQQPQAA